MFSLLLSAHSSLSAFSLAAVVCCRKTHLHPPSAGTESRGWKSLSSVLLAMESGSSFWFPERQGGLRRASRSQQPCVQWSVKGPSCTRALREQALGSEHHHPLLLLRLSREKEKIGPILMWIICSQTVNWRPLLGLRLDAEKWSNWLQEPKEIASGWRNVFRQESVQLSFSQGVFPQWKLWQGWQHIWLPLSLL